MPAAARRSCDREGNYILNAGAGLATLLILGAGGHGRVVADAALRDGRWASVRATDRDADRCQGELLPGVALEQIGTALTDGVTGPVHIAIGMAGARQAEALAVGIARLVTVTHPFASVTAHASLGAGCFVAAQAVVAPRVKLGTSVIVNHGAVVDHDCEVGDYTHIAPGAALGGNVRIGRRVLVGTRACVLPGICICDDVTVGAGAVVHVDIAQPGTYAGVPIRRVR